MLCVLYRLDAEKKGDSTIERELDFGNRKIVFSMQEILCPTYRAR